MKKTTYFLLICDILILLVMFGMLMADKETLRDNVIRLHVIANSDSEQDQTVKLKVKNAIIELLEPQLRDVDSVEHAREYLQSNLETIRKVSDRVLRNEGYDLCTSVTLSPESFPVRHYDTFSLPSGVYESLRVTIGEGEGKNWWCVVFPSLCIPASSQSVQSCAVRAGFSDSLCASLVSEDEYEIGFFLLDCIGKLENLFFRG